MSGLTKPQTTTTTQQSAPWSEAQPYLREVLGGAQSAYRSGQGFDYPSFGTTVPFSPQTSTSLNRIEQMANAGNPLGVAAQDKALGILNTGGMSDYQRSALQPTHDIATGARSIGTEGDYRGLLGMAGNPYYEGMVDREAGKLTDDINRGFSMSGRYASPSHTAAIAEQVGDFRNRAMSDQYSQNIAMQRGLLGDITGVQGANLANQVNAGAQVGGAENMAANQVAQFAGMAPGIYGQQYLPAERLASVGSMYEDQATRQMNEDIARFNAQQNEPWNLLNAYQGLIGGAGALGGSSSTSVPAPSMLQGILSGALTGGTLGAQAGFPFGLLGALGGGVAGAF